MKFSILVTLAACVLVAPSARAAIERAPESSTRFQLLVNDSFPGGASSHEANRSVTVTVPLVPGEPAWRIEFHPEPLAAGPPGRLRRVGRIEVRAAEGREPSQVIHVQSFTSLPMFLANARVVDVNFDGHADLVTLAEFGANWARHDFWLFDPRSRRFARTPLAIQLAKLRASHLTFDSAGRRIRAVHASRAAGEPEEWFEIRDGRLVRAAAHGRAGGSGR